ncbi:MAG: ABC transporter ATP-binding protein, partial [Clostridia bacterium]|nr:ABC transporter ATP-binding protein [Clostridia bacterium]
MLELKNIRVVKNKKEILKNVTVSLKPHTLTVVIGKNGSGKSTLLSCLTGESKYQGTIHFDDKDLALMPKRQRAAYISFLPQSLPSVPITVENLVAMGRTPYVDMGKNLSEKDEEQIEKAIADTGIETIRHKKLTEISGGEKQRAYIAMVLAQNTRVIALDEPTTYMDIQFQKELRSLLTELKEKHKKTLITVMHDLSMAAEIADCIILLDEGRVVFSG